MRIFQRIPVFALAAAFVFVSAPAQPHSTAVKKKINSATDLPRFSYPMSTPPSTLLTADDATFNAFAARVIHDIDSVLGEYDVEDRSTLREFYSAKLNLDLLTGDNQAALSSIEKIKSLQDKPEAQASSGLFDRPIIDARVTAHTAAGAAMTDAFEKSLERALNASDWRLVQDTVKGMKGNFEIVSPTLIIAGEKQSLDPAAAQSNSVDMPAAEQLIADRLYLTVYVPLKEPALQALTAYIAAHNIQKPDIWAARDVRLTPDQKLHPVRIAIWDTGVDTSLYPNQLFTDPNPGPHSPHGLAYDLKGDLFNGDLQPLTAEQKDTYPKVLKLEQGFSDLFNSIDSSAASEAKSMLATMPPERLPEFMKQLNFLGQYMHGTHVAGIAVRGNPAAQLVVAQFYDSLPEIPFAPTVEWATKFKADFQQIGDYFRTNDVRVVNMSWSDDVSEFEQWLTKTSSEKDPAARKQSATAVYNVWHDAVENAIRSAPHTLFICAAGNSDSDTAFGGAVPNSLHLPNLIAVGAVDQAGEETSFTSYGDTVVVDADGYQVESYVPGGTRLKMSGTSMASPNVVNLAAKLIALDPTLTPEQTIALIRRGADRSADGRRNLINPQATVALLKSERLSAISR